MLFCHALKNLCFNLRDVRGLCFRFPVFFPTFLDCSLFFMGLLGCKIIQATMWPFLIIYFDYFINGLLCFLVTTIDLVAAELMLQDAVYPFCQGILIRTTILGHADGDIFLMEHL